VLCRPEIREAIEMQDIHLTTFADVAHLEPRRVGAGAVL
jgi:hypothetical protein